VQALKLAENAASAGKGYGAATARNRQARQSAAGGEHGEEARFYAGYICVL